ncbi:malectin domain-containing carbohydrate-binding protein [Hymenobacter sp. GOD-10R]|uniref:malectin domain-containing carbohydrate-binding protein n=1 Tax=Hymenobacter sp. GOD-10R TaxID=3093922 RepID=UPI002D76B542|nr:malectin domain-containing carbohydrate-binding protein [Hymenobacter sp. GOD-10R]WRQ31835.1 malectin domain-containing carbohydrate-binding protein [Hymenobacter sp. GOD-10R]
MKRILLFYHKNWLNTWLLGLLLSLSTPWLAHSQTTSPFNVQVTPTGPVTLLAGRNQTLTATATYPAFSVGAGFNGTVNAVALQRDGKVVVGGEFTAYNGITRNRLVRLNPDGSLDPSFNVGTGLDGSINAVLVQPDGNIVIGGMFNSYNGTARSNLVRLTATGSIDASFRQNGSGLNGAVNALALQPDGQLVVGGAFTNYNGTARTFLARLTTVGNLDISLVPSLNFAVTLLARQTDGKLVVGNTSTLVRLMYNGQLDPTFTNSLVSSSRFETIRLTALILQPDNKAIVGGYIQYSSGSANSLVARLNLSGGQEFRYNDPNLTTLGVTALAIQADGRILVGQSSFGAPPAGGSGYVNNYLVRLTAAGNQEAVLGSAVNFNALRPVAAIVVQPNGQIIIGGSFVTYNGTAQNRLARLDANGALNATAVPVAGANYIWNTGATGPNLTVTTSGTYSATATFAGQSATSNAVVVTVIPIPTAPSSFTVRVTPDGPIALPIGGSQTLTATALYPAFDTGVGFTGPVTTLAVQPNGKILVGGSFTAYKGMPGAPVARLNADGSLDASFQVMRAGLSGSVQALVVQRDGKIVVGGSFQLNRGALRYIARFNADGSLDSTFVGGSTAAGFNGTVNALAVQANGKLLVGGTFTLYNNIPRNRVAQLNADGSLDTGFSSTGFNGKVAALAVQADGKVLVGGDFTSYGTTLREGIARLNPDGNLDESFVPPIANFNFTRHIRVLLVQADGNVLVGGDRTFINNTQLVYLTRLTASGAVDRSFTDWSDNYGYVNTLAMQADGKLLIGGFLVFDNGTTRLARLGINGSLEQAFALSGTWSDAVNAVVPLSNNQFLAGGNFPQGITRLNADGSVNNTATPVVGANYTWNTGATGPNLLVTTSGSFLVTATLNGYSATSNAVIVTTPNTSTTRRINAGGMTLTTTQGTFAADQYFSTASATASVTAPIAGTTDDALYQTERYSTNGQLRYAVPVTNGAYRVVLHFAETYWTQAGQRVFNIALENTTVRTNYDIVAKVGPLTATTETFTVMVLDGVLNLDMSVPYLSGGRDQAKLSGLEILPTTSSQGALAMAPADKRSITTSTLQVYPNPTTDGYCTLSYSSVQAQSSTLTLVDHLGRLVYEQPVTLQAGPNYVTVSPTLVQAGIYQFVLRTADGQRHSQKIVVQP